MRLLSAFAFIFVIGFPGRSQDMITDSTVALVAYWSEGDVKEFEVWNSRYNYNNNNLESADSNSYQVRITVIEEQPYSYLLSWQMNLNEEQKADPFAMIFDGMTILYQTDELGFFVGITNLDELMVYVEKSLKKVKEAFDEHDLEAMETIEKLSKSLLKRDAIELLILRDLQLYHQAFGFEYFRDQIGIYEIEIPNVFGGDPYPGVAETKAVNVNEVAKTCTIIYDQFINKEAAATLIKETLDDISEEESSSLTFSEFSDHSEFDAELTSGWLKRASFERTVVVESSKRIDRISITEN